MFYGGTTRPLNPGINPLMESLTVLVMYLLRRVTLWNSINYLCTFMIKQLLPEQIVIGFRNVMICFRV